MRKTLSAYPYLVWAVLFIVVPLLLVAYFGFTVERADGSFVFSLEHFKEFFTSPIYMTALWRSVWMAAVATAICLLLGYPAAYFLAGSTFKNKGLLIMLLVIPMWMNLLLRTYAWVIVLDTKGLLNTLLGFIGLEPFEFLYGTHSIIFGMVYNFLPFMILPIHSVLVKMDNSLVEAAQDLGAPPARVFFKVTLPMSVPGILSGISMVFMPAVTTFAISDILSGKKIQLMGNVIEQKFLLADDWNFGSAMSLILMVLIIITMLLPSDADKNGEGGGLL